MDIRAKSRTDLRLDNKEDIIGGPSTKSMSFRASHKYRPYLIYHEGF